METGGHASSGGEKESMSRCLSSWKSRVDGGEREELRAAKVKAAKEKKLPLWKRMDWDAILLGIQAAGI